MQGARRMPRRREPTKDAASRDSPGGAALRLRSRGLRMGEPIPRGRDTHFGAGQPGELKHLSTPRKGNQTETPPVAASERGPAQTGVCVRACARCHAGVEGASPRGRTPGRQSQRRSRAEDAWEGARHRVRAPYATGAPCRNAAQSTAGHEEPGGKQGGPPPKAKHSPATDSGRVP